MNNYLFQIQNLSCAYKKGKEVLFIKDLQIPSKKLIILLGKSGSGKSTFLETLGLMNNTISSGDIIFYPGENHEAISYQSLWKKKDLKEISKIRREYLSFIFQNTNLMPNFSAYENACLTELIKGTNYTLAENHIRHLMEELGLKDIDQSRKASEMSGGQKQRIAFIRAIASRFEVLFGDEPTGNLDEFNSRELIGFLKNHNIQNEKSSIIVTHNINLAIEFGDMIILLSRENSSNPFCEITPDNIFSTHDNGLTWTNHSNKSINSIELSSRIQNTLL